MTPASRCAVLLIMVCTILSTAPASSAEEVVAAYAGTICRPDRDGAQILSKGGVLYNKSTAPLTVTCPIAMRIMPAKWWTILVDRIDNGSTAHLACRARLANPTYAFDTVSSTSQSQLLLSGYLDDRGSPLILECTIPGLVNGAFAGINAIVLTLH